MDSGMNQEALKNELEDFKQVCFEKGYIYNNLSFDEAYPGVIPTPFIVNMVTQKSWQYSDNTSKALDKLIEVLWSKVKVKTRESIFTLSIYSIDEMVNSERTRDREQVAINPDLSSEQIKKLYYDKEVSVQNKIKDYLKIVKLNIQQIESVFDTEDKNIIGLFIQNNSASRYFLKSPSCSAELRAELRAKLIIYSNETL